jgi:hypothetical protein
LKGKIEKQFKLTNESKKEKKKTNKEYQFPTNLMIMDVI